VCDQRPVDRRHIFVYFAAGKNKRERCGERLLRRPLSPSWGEEFVTPCVQERYQQAAWLLFIVQCRPNGLYAV